MRFIKEQYHCGNYLLKTLWNGLNDVEEIISSIEWKPSFSISHKNKVFQHQAGYNKNFEKRFTEKNWDLQPILRTDPKLIGDFRKGLIFVEIQFGNSATLYRDFYKFQYGLANGLLSLAVLIVPTKPSLFFPYREKSVLNMAEFDKADKILSVLPINVPVLLLGLLPEN